MNWKEILAPALQSQKMQNIKGFLKDERATKNIYPEGKDVFRPFELCPFEKTKVVILGDEPYNTPGTADGLAFSTMQEDIPAPLLNIFKEIYRDLNIQYYYNSTFEEFFPNGNLEQWARNGFLLLNTCLTVEEGKPGSHSTLGWEIVIEKVIEGLMAKEEQVIFLLWGDSAKEYVRLIKKPSKHVFFEADHPTSENFIGCRHFSIVRDVIPASNDLFPSVRLDAYFDKEKAKELVNKEYPIDSQKICDYIDKELIIHVPVNKEIYWKEVRKFEKLMSTNTLKDE